MSIHKRPIYQPGQLIFCPLCGEKTVKIITEEINNSFRDRWELSSISIIIEGYCFGCKGKVIFHTNCFEYVKAAEPYDGCAY